MQQSGVRLSVCLSVCPSVRPSVRPSVCPSVCLSVRPSVCLSVCPSVRPSVRLSVRLSVCPSVRLSVCLSVCPSVCLSVCLSVCPSVCPVDRQQQPRPAGLLLVAGVCSRYWSIRAGAVLQARRRSAASAGSVMLRTDGGGSTGTCSTYTVGFNENFPSTF